VSLVFETRCILQGKPTSLNESTG